jgi:hypothetical protein
MALVALDVSALQQAPQLVAQDVDREMLRSAVLAVALAGGDAQTSIQSHLFDLRTDDLGSVLSAVPKGAPERGRAAAGRQWAHASSLHSASGRSQTTVPKPLPPHNHTRVSLSCHPP